MNEAQKLEATRTICDVVREYIYGRGGDAEIDAAKVTAIAVAAASAIVSACLKINAAGEFSENWAAVRLQMAASQITPGQAMPAVLGQAYDALAREDQPAASEFIRWLVVEVCGQEWTEPPIPRGRPSA